MNKAQLIKRVEDILKILNREYPEARTHLDFSSPFELLVSTVLAAQCTDVRINLVMPPLYKKIYKGPKDILKDGIENFTNNIKSITFFNSKAKSIIGMCEMLVNDFGGKVPGTIEELTKLPGVGRKSASVVLGNCFGQKDVIIVDTHLKRVSGRLGLIENDNPEKIETELKEIVPSEQQYNYSLKIGEHGRVICDAKKPKCEECFLNNICPSKNLLTKQNKKAKK
ncbi:MAG: endonuclease III [Ignavibacteriae bacterium]|nr:endonuclease III [Ignavibacteriota bacterium]